MPHPSFEHTVKFHEVQKADGGIIAIPIISVTLIQPDGNRVDLPLIFDTGASTTTLRDDLYPLLGVPAWDAGEPVQTGTAGGDVTAYRYHATLELFGRSVACPVHLLQTIPKNPLYLGLFGREQIFEQFGFGFWEGAREMYITLNP